MGANRSTQAGGNRDEKAFGRDDAAEVRDRRAVERDGRAELRDGDGFDRDLALRRASTALRRLLRGVELRQATAGGTADEHRGAASEAGSSEQSAIDDAAAATDRRLLALGVTDFLDRIDFLMDAVAADRAEAQRDRKCSASDRKRAAGDRDESAADRGEAAVERQTRPPAQRFTQNRPGSSRPR